jgi:CheY-like chemotaxis protein
MATVLVVDDDPQARKPLARLLEMEGHRVFCADNAVAAMAAAASRQDRPDLIILDVSMPPMDGLTFLFLLRERSFGRDIPVIVVSGHDDEHTIQRARDLGVVQYLVKTHFKTSELLDIVRRYCSAGAAQEEGAGI